MSTLSSLTSILESNNCDTTPSAGCDKNPGEALAKFDFSHTDVGAQGPDHSDAHAALASMSSQDALDYAISQLGAADHFDVGHFDTPADTPHDT
jgi:hypothetical protein